jgi:hypothetical protein
MDGVCYEATLLDPQTMNTFQVVGLEDDLVSFDPSTLPTPTPTPTHQDLNFDTLTTEFESMPIEDREQKAFTGTIVKVELEGGFYGIELPSVNGGGKFLPINIQSELVGKEGDEIVVTSSFIKKNLVGFQMWGTYVYINSFSLINEASVKKDSIVTVLDGKYLLGNLEYSSPYKINLGIYNLKNIPSNHPLFLENADESKIKLIGTTSSTGPYGTGFTGDAFLYVYEDFGTISYKCANHGYMGGQNNLIFDSTSELGYDAPTPTPTSTPTPTPTSTETPTFTPTPTSTGLLHLSTRNTHHRHLPINTLSLII